ncbi:MAG: 8-oxo-dGTP diphosphatase [Planifilum sp.]|jgi:8-oxo-dGTP diphosphatase
MQRVVNCILRDRDRVLLLKKPRRGWWVAPGGKMKPTESIMDTLLREYEEETGLQLENARLCGVFTMCVEDEGRLVKEWMLFTFFSDRYKGTPLEKSEEGILAWHPVSSLSRLPAAAGDRMFWERIALRQEFLVGRFVYSSEEELLRHTLSSLSGTEEIQS